MLMLLCIGCSVCHYMADVYGHSLGTNLVVPEVVYPKVGAKYGKVVTYEE